MHIISAATISNLKSEKIMKKMTLIKKLIIISATCSAALMLSSAHADTIQWTLSNVTFDGGGTASGTFATDSVSGSMLSYNLTTTAATNVYPGYNYNSGYNYNASSSFILGSTSTDFEIYSKSFSPSITIMFKNSLTTAGPTDAITLLMECGPMCNDQRRGLSGGEAISISAVPEPETYAMLLAGLGLIGFTLRPRKT